MLSSAEFEAMAERIFEFHRKRAPGIYIGIAMVDRALDELGPVTEKLNVYAETQACLSDVIQIMTGCTTGNRYLRVLKCLGRFAVTVFDRADGRGVRVSVDLTKIDIERMPETSRFFHRQRDPAVQAGGPAREASGMKIMEEFRQFGKELLRVQKVRVRDYGKPPMIAAAVCCDCGESYLKRDEMHVKCDFCSGTTPYFFVEEGRVC
ncbi:MAG TPA: formylmethanofuran dehydrogenase subunit E family protein [Candidatus Ozemobacteraceae bacterium]|nr:formylmethanofuran dehydrogenase subunit E family protein [Candidatus Ozemobacteraceae bacterium]